VRGKDQARGKVQETRNREISVLRNTQEEVATVFEFDVRLPSRAVFFCVHRERGMDRGNINYFLRFNLWYAEQNIEYEQLSTPGNLLSPSLDAESSDRI
jgi:hypothetical protein